MTQLLRFRVGLMWDTGGPGVNTYYMSEGLPAPGDTDTWIERAAEEIYQVMVDLSPFRINTCQWTLERSVDVIDVASGNIVDQRDHTLDTFAGAGQNNQKSLSRAQQLYCRFLTDQWSDGRRLAGGTFIGPLGYDAVDANGQFSNAQKATIENAFSAITTGVGSRLAVYSKPQGGRPGRYGDVTAVRVKTTPGSLRSRRD